MLDVQPVSLEIDPESECERLVVGLRQAVRWTLRRSGAVLGISGGVDSSVVLALCVRAFGAERLTAVMMPEKDSDSESESLARQLAGHFGVEAVLEDITPILEGFGCYPRRDQAIQRLFPEYDPGKGYRCKISLPHNVLDDDTLNYFTLTVITPGGEEKSQRLPLGEYLQVVAASNIKQRARMAMLYYHAELRNFAVIGTANRDEHAQGFFVKYGDGGVDVQPIAHLYKTQVCQLAAYLDVPEEIRRRPPATDTYSGHSTQEEFFFRLPFEIMDPIWEALERGLPPARIASQLGLTKSQVQRAYDDLRRKLRTTGYLRMPPIFLDGENRPR